MTDRLDLPRRYRRIVEALLREHVPDAEVWAYGSRVNGESHEGSDLDLVVRGPDLKRIPSGPLAGLIEALEDSKVPILVQTQDWARLPESFHQEIEQNYVVVREGVSAGSAGLSGEWGKVTLGDVCTKIGSGSTPRGGKEVYLEDGPFALIRSQNVYNDGFARDGLAFISDEYAEALHNVEVLPDDVLLNITGDSVARVCQVDTTVLPARVNQHVAIIRPDSDKLDAAYLRYYLAAPEVQEMLLSWAGSGGTRNALTKQMIESFQVKAPTDLAEQRAIAHVLGSLDDKIELNRRMNETLEAMARTLFKSWFVDFDPVRAKMEDRWRQGESLPGLPAEHYDLFPDRLVVSELGEIPDGWEVKTLGDVAEQRREGVSPGHIDPDTPYIALEHMPKHCIALEDWTLADGLASGKFRFEQGDILFGKLRPYFHKVGVAPLDGVCSTDIVVISPKWDNWFGFVLCNVSSSGFVNYTDAASTGTKMPRTKWGDMARYKVTLPSGELAKAFNEMISPWIMSMLWTIHASRALAGQRDALLPGLVSGEMQVTCSLGSRFPSMSTQVQVGNGFQI